MAFMSQSQRHPFKVAAQCAFGTTKSSRSSFSPLEWSAYRGNLGGPWHFGDSSIIFGPPCWKHALPGVSSDQSSFWPLTNAILLLILGFLFGLWPNWWHAFQLGLTQWWHIPPFLFMVTLNHRRVISFCPLGGTQGYSIQDRSHGLWAEESGNSTQHICHYIILPLLVF